MVYFPRDLSVEKRRLRDCLPDSGRLTEQGLDRYCGFIGQQTYRIYWPLPPCFVTSHVRATA